MRVKKKRAEEHENTERWMVSYADFVTLLFCFFTAMYAISNVDTEKLGKFVKSMRFAFNRSVSTGNAFTIIEGVQLVTPVDAEVEAVVMEAMDKAVAGSKGGIEIKRDRRGIVISVMDKFLFESGYAKLREEARPLVDSIASAVLRLSNVVRIEGHTDNQPIKSSEFPSNWELSSQRAINVAKYFVIRHKIQPERLTTIGYSEFKPVASNDTPEGRAVNRRVDIVILNETESLKEPQ